MTKKLKAIILILTLVFAGTITTVVLLLFSTSSSATINFAPTNSSIATDPENHLIKNVPYVGQETFFYCAFATPTMVFKYYGINTSLHEVLYYSGIGSSLLYLKSIRLIPQHIFYNSFILSQVPSERDFLATLYGLSNNLWIPDSSTIPAEECWQDYWIKVKENVSQDLPVITSVDPYSIPYLREKLNATDNTIHGGHSILLVGYNDSNGTVCYNDPAAALWNDAKNGTYVYLSKEILKGALQNTTGSKYYIETFLNHSIPPYSLEKRFEKAHERNIQKVNGDRKVYSDLSLNLFSYLGIKGLKAFKGDIRMGITHRMTTVMIYAKLVSDPTLLTSIYNTIVVEKYNASQYLSYIQNYLHDQKLKTLCTHDATLLQRESNCWKNMSLLVSELNILGKTHGPVTTWMLSFSITQKMKKTVNEMISIESAMIY